VPGKIVDSEGQHHALAIFGRAQAVDAGDGGDDDDVFPAEQAAHGGEAEALDLVVDAGVLLNPKSEIRNPNQGAWGLKDQLYRSRTPT